MNVLAFVTGATGFLGRHTARRLAVAGYRTFGIGHGHLGGESPASWGMERFVTADVTLKSLEALAATAGEPSIVVHCAGSGAVAFSLAEPHADFCRTVGATVDVLEFARRRAPAVRVVYPSSAAVYGEAGNCVLTEGLSPAPISPYGLHKRIAEDMCRSFAVNQGVPVAVIRFFSLYGEGLCKQLLWDACRKAHDGSYRFFGIGDECRDWLHVSDAVELLLLAASNAGPDCPVVNGGSGEGLTIREILTILGQMWSPPLIPEFSGASKAGDPQSLLADIRRARAWGFSPAIGIHEGLARYLSWFNRECSA